jgi:hypothetical protein
MQIPENNVEVLMFALTLKDRENKNKKTKEKWLSKGFKKIGRKRLLDYWTRRVHSSPEDFELYKSVLLGYERRNYQNMSAPNSTVRINMQGIAPKDLPRLLFNNLIADDAQKEYEKLKYSMLTVVSQLLGVSEQYLEVMNLEIQIKDNTVLEFLKNRIEEKISKDIQPLIQKTTQAANATSGELPSVWSMVKNVGKAAVKSAKSGFKMVTASQYEERTNICKSCEFWNPKAFYNTGQCVKCGCSTKAKLKLATEKCPVGKWFPTV